MFQIIDNWIGYNIREMQYQPGIRVGLRPQSYINMQQSQQILPCVKHKLPEPNSILPSQSLRSQPARHIRKRVHNSGGDSSYNWPLDQSGPSNRQLIASILAEYYGPSFNINNLLTFAQKIVFLNPLVHPSQLTQPQYFFGSISTDISHSRSSISHPYTNQQTYQLQFDDKIESGNLYFALQHQPGTYLLANRLDYNTRSYGQWFYFKARNVTANGKNFRFCIVNMTKNGAMFGKGLKISVCRDGFWTKQGCQIQYLQNKFVRKPSETNNSKINPQTYYTLSFNVFIDSHETIQLAYNEPYTYSKLGKKLDNLSAQYPNLSRSLLCRTPLGNRIELLTITNKESVAQKKVIYITARAHPIQTAGSFVMQGILDQLLKPAQPWIIERLLDHYIIKIVPMINPDGVIIGNSRCNLYGYDLNRQWKDPGKNTAPQIMSLKKNILKYQGRVEMFLDLHGHSTKKSVFAYGCHDFKNPIASRQFPYLLSKLSDKDFLYSQCRFSALNQSKNSNKDGTARITLWKKLKIPNIFTIQNSYCCAQGSQLHYDSRSYANIGKDIVMSLCSYFRKQQPELVQKIQRYSNEENFSKSQHITKSTKLCKSDLLSDLRSNSSLINLNIKQFDEVSSDSQPEDRVQHKNKQYETPIKLHRNLSNKVYMKSKTQKYMKDTTKKNAIQFTNLKKNTTIQAKGQKQDEINQTPSVFERRMRKKYLRNLSPLTKQQRISQTKGWMKKQSQPQDCQKTKRVDSQPQLQRHKIQSMRQTNAGLSIVQIGMQTNLDYSRGDIFELSKAVSAKNINSEYGIYHNRLNTLNPNRTSSKNDNKNIVKYLKNIIYPDSDAFTDYHQYRQPVLKVKKNINQNANKLKQFINKINVIQNQHNWISAGPTNQLKAQQSAVDQFFTANKFTGLKSSKGKSGVNVFVHNTSKQ